MQRDNSENKDLDTLFFQVEVAPVTQSNQSLVMINTSPVRALRK